MSIAIRANPDILPDLLAGIDTVQQNLDAENAELASGQSINAPADNPAGMEALILNHAASALSDTFQQNIGDLTARLQTADSVLGSAVTAVNSAISLGVQAGNSTLSDQDRQAIASNLQSIQQQLVSIGNTSYSGTYLFSGTLVDTQPFTLDPASPNGVDYAGNGAVTSVEIATGESISANSPGNQLFLNPAGNLLGSLSQLITAVQNNTGIGAANTTFGQAASEFDAQRISYGASLNQLQSTGTLLSSQQVQLATQASTIAGANTAQVATDFSQSEIAYQSLIEAEIKVLNLPTLLSLIS
jgi:flagellar hook-associated protein 3 FlgL